MDVCAMHWLGRSGGVVRVREVYAEVAPLEPWVTLLQILLVHTSGLWCRQTNVFVKASNLAYIAI
eukprot:8575530-Pyramimonas_sp.AAC.1